MRLATTVVLVVLAGCQAQTPLILDPSPETVGETGVSVGTQQPTGMGDGTSADGSTTATGTTGSTSGNSGTFVMEPDGGGNTWTCDPWQQDCEPGNKCVYTSTDGQVFDGSTCVPLDPVPKGSWEACTVLGGPLRGVDDCAAGHWCSAAPPTGTSGICLPYCDAQEQCPDAMGFCPLMGAASLICYPKCDPLIMDDCGADRGCMLVGGGFVCSAWASGTLGYLEECSGDWECQEGYLCTNDGAAIGCAASCCQPLCELSMPGACPDAASGQMCEPIDPVAGAHGFGSLERPSTGEHRQPP